jgi:hypothetical protein
VIFWRFGVGFGGRGEVGIKNHGSREGYEGTFPLEKGENKIRTL